MAHGGDAHVAVPYADVGDRFAVSRTHVRKLLADAEAHRLVKLHARGGRRVEILPRAVGEPRPRHRRLHIPERRGLSGASAAHPVAAS